MKAVRCNIETFGKMLRIKHSIEDQKRDIVNMSDVQDVILWQHEALVEALGDENPERLDEILGQKFKFVEAADVAAEPLNIDEEDEDEEETPRPRKKKTTKKRRKKARKPTPKNDEEDEEE